jgi:hypothetical protein
LIGTRHLGVALIGACLTLAACARSTAPEAPVTNVVQTPAASTHEAALAELTDRCGLPRTALQLQGDQLRLQPPSNARPAAIECVLREIRASGLDANMTMGFVGNEFPDGNTMEGARR